MDRGPGLGPGVVLIALWLTPLVLLLTTGFVRSLLDRAVFRFSSPEVRQAARGLLQS